MTLEEKKAIQAIEDSFKKLGITKEDYPKYTDMNTFSNTFTQITIYDKPGKITSTGTLGTL